MLSANGLAGSPYGSFMPFGAGGGAGWCIDPMQIQSEWPVLIEPNRLGAGSAGVNGNRDGGGGACVPGGTSIGGVVGRGAGAMFPNSGRGCWGNVPE